MCARLEATISGSKHEIRELLAPDLAQPASFARDQQWLAQVRERATKQITDGSYLELWEEIVRFVPVDVPRHIIDACRELYVTAPSSFYEQIGQAADPLAVNEIVREVVSEDLESLINWLEEPSAGRKILTLALVRMFRHGGPIDAAIRRDSSSDCADRVMDALTRRVAAPSASLHQGELCLLCWDILDMVHVHTLHNPSVWNTLSNRFAERSWTIFADTLANHGFDQGLPSWRLREFETHCREFVLVNLVYSAGIARTRGEPAERFLDTFERVLDSLLNDPVFVATPSVALEALTLGAATCAEMRRDREGSAAWWLSRVESNSKRYGGYNFDPVDWWRASRRASWLTLVGAVVSRLCRDQGMPEWIYWRDKVYSICDEHLEAWLWHDSFGCPALSAIPVNLCHLAVGTDSWERVRASLLLIRSVADLERVRQSAVGAPAEIIEAIESRIKDRRAFDEQLAR